MPVCIAGMHRSGTSMVCHLLHRCGLYLGRNPDEYGEASAANPDGFWEHTEFVALNDRILQRLGGGWDLVPDFIPGWELLPELLALRTEAARLLHPFAGREPWGWKDPRNSLTLPFWKLLLPNLKVLICLRNPLEVAWSLRQRGDASFAFSQHLWLSYYQHLLESVPAAARVVTHIDAYFHDPAGELHRILELLELPVPPSRVQRACSLIAPTLRHHQATPAAMRQAGTRADVRECYRQLCAAAGPVYHRSLDFTAEAERLDERPVIDSSELLNTTRELWHASARLAQLTDRLAARRYRWLDGLVQCYERWLRRRPLRSRQVAR